MSEVTNWIQNNNLTEYESIFELNGYVDLIDMLDFTDDQLLELGIKKIGSRRKILRLLAEAKLDIQTKQQKEIKITESLTNVAECNESKTDSNKRIVICHTCHSPKVKNFNSHSKWKHQCEKVCNNYQSCHLLHLHPETIKEMKVKSLWKKKVHLNAKQKKN
jgi:hypothetical protein